MLLSLVLAAGLQGSLNRTLPWASVPTALRAAAFSPNGRYLALSAVAGVQIFDLQNPDAPSAGPLVAVYPSNIVWDPVSKDLFANSSLGNGTRSTLEGKETEFQKVPHWGVDASHYAVQASFFNNGDDTRIYVRSVIDGKMVASIKAGRQDGPKIRTAEGPGGLYVGFGDNIIHWGRVDLKGEKWRPLKGSTDSGSGGYSVDATGNLIAIDAHVVDLNSNDNAKVPKGYGYRFSADGKTLVYLSTVGDKYDKLAFYDPKSKRETLVASPFSDGGLGLIQPSPDGSYMVVGRSEPRGANPVAEPRARQAWIVRRDGKIVQLRSLDALFAYNEYLVGYAAHKDEVDAYLKRERDREEEIRNPKPVPAEPADYGAENLVAVANFDREAREKGFLKIDETPVVDTAGTEFHNLNTTPFTPTAGWQYLIYAYADLSKTRRKVHYLYLHTYEGSKLLRTDEWDLQMRGSIAEVAASFSSYKPANTKEMTYTLQLQPTRFSVTTDGFVPAKIVVYRRPAKS